jgi:K+-sensing histidine kinase KdpD
MRTVSAQKVSPRGCSCSLRVCVCACVCVCARVFVCFSLYHSCNKKKNVYLPLFMLGIVALQISQASRQRVTFCLFVSTSVIFFFGTTCTTAHINNTKRHWSTTVFLSSFILLIPFLFERTPTKFPSFHHIWVFAGFPS